MEELEQAVKRFLNFARNAPEYGFLMTKVACGIAGKNEEEVKKLFAVYPPNVIMPSDWR